MGYGRYPRSEITKSKVRQKQIWEQCKKVYEYSTTLKNSMSMQLKVSHLMMIDNATLHLQLDFPTIYARVTYVASYERNIVLGYLRKDFFTEEEVEKISETFMNDFDEIFGNFDEDEFGYVLKAAKRILDGSSIPYDYYKKTSFERMTFSIKNRESRTSNPKTKKELSSYIQKLSEKNPADYETMEVCLLLFGGRAFFKKGFNSEMSWDELNNNIVGAKNINPVLRFLNILETSTPEDDATIVKNYTHRPTTSITKYSHILDQKTSKKVRPESRIKDLDDMTVAEFRIITQSGNFWGMFKKNSEELAKLAVSNNLKPITRKEFLEFLFEKNLMDPMGNEVENLIERDGKNFDNTAHYGLMKRIIDLHPEYTTEDVKIIIKVLSKDCTTKWMTQPQTKFLLLMNKDEEVSKLLKFVEETVVPYEKKFTYRGFEKFLKLPERPYDLPAEWFWELIK